MRIALTGPLWTRPLLPYLDARQQADLPPGISTPTVTNLATGYADRGVEVLVVTLDPSVTSEFIASGPGMRLCVGPYRQRHRARDGFRTERAYVSAVLRRERPDVVHAHWTYEFALGALASKVPTLTTVHDWGPQVLRYQFTPYRAVRLLMQFETLRRGQHLTAVSPYIQQRVRRWSRRNPVVIPNALPEAAFDSTVRSLNVASPLLLAVNAGFSRYKNVTALLEAFKIVRSNRPGCQLWLAGSGYEPGGAAHRWASDHGVQAGVTFYGPVSNDRVHQLMRAVDLLVHPSLEESFGLVVLEAMAQGLPVVGGNQSGAVPWVLGDGDAGVLADVRSPARLAASVERVLANPARWAELSQKGYKRASSEFSLAAALDRYWSMYERVVAGAGWS